MIVQRLIKHGSVYRLDTSSLCQQHFEENRLDVCFSAPSDDPCEVCLAERRQAAANHERQQAPWLAKLFDMVSKSGMETWKFSIYTAGPMTGMINFNKEAFWRMERMLSRLGFRVLSPAHYDGEHTYEWFMEEDIKLIFQANALIMLKGWEHSTGATVEYSVAKITGREVFYEL